MYKKLYALIMVAVVLCGTAFVENQAYASQIFAKIEHKREIKTTRDIRHPQRRKLVENALECVGIPYKWGGTTTKGFDCSGFVQYVYDKAGFKLPRTAKEQTRKALKMGRLAPGDIVGFTSHGPTGYHTGIYIGNGWFVHSPRTGKSIEVSRIDSNYFKRRFIGALSPFSS